MYRCTECNSEYEERPDFCECGNDEFIEIYDDVTPISDDNFEYDEPEPVRKQPKPRLSQKEIEEMEEEKREKTKSLIVLGITLFLCIVVLFLPPHRKPKMEKVKEKVAAQNIKLPSVNTYWDDSLPSAYKREDPIASLPLLNSYFSTISPVLREYLVNIGKEFNKKWNVSMVDGYGECKVQFVINKEGGLDVKSIVTSSDNQSLDDSVNLLLTNVTGFEIPPDDYKGEKIYITFSIDPNGQSKVSYPSK